ncbi:S41 family peptidase [Calidifontibacillus oryziterrae]|uniref:S41 family peptidase n=1 Tax=Calidifontibacillus oryziterrae TaxID=1191699 RepID=UPI0002E45949|nr:S41 family peptidase [Calidifontibacillus oryziterrae]
MQKLRRRRIKILSGDLLSSNLRYIKNCISVLLLFLLLFGFQTTTFAGDIEEIRQMLEEGYYKPVSKQILQKTTIEEILTALNDPYTEFFTEQEFEEFKKAIDMNYVGIGILGEQHEQGVKVLHLFETGGAIKSDLQVDDIIFEVDGTNIEGKTIDEAQQYLLGDPGTIVNLKVYRSSKNEPVTITITREKTEIAPTVESAWLGGNIGFVQLKSFNEQLVPELEEAIQFLDGVDGWIVDIRDNGGGYLDAAQDAAGFFKNVKAAVAVEGQDKLPRIYLSTEQDMKFTGPVIMLINSETASAAEILAGAVKDQNGAQLYGQTTYGKGLAQSVFMLSSGNMFKMTVAQFYTPKGHVINNIGISPNIETEFGEELITAHRDLILRTSHDRNLVARVEDEGNDDAGFDTEEDGNVDDRLKGGSTNRSEKEDGLGNSTGANSTGANSTGANSTGANSTGANSTGANSTGANNTGANSAGANSTGANSTGANSTGANNTGANSTGANNTGANSTGANSTGANIEDNIENVEGAGSVASIVNFTNQNGRFAKALARNPIITIKLEDPVSAEKLMKRMKLIQLGDREIELIIRPTSLRTFEIAPKENLNIDSTYLLLIDSGTKDYILDFQTSDKINEKVGNETNFADVMADDFFASSVKVLSSEGIVKGVDDGKFAPYSNVTREQAAVFFTRALGLETENVGQLELSFKDVQEGDYFYSSVVAVNDAGIMKGKSAQKFGTGTILTREEMAALLARAFDLTSKISDNLLFTDIEASPFEADILKVYQNGIASGTSEATFSPQKPVTRGEFATFLYRAIVNQNSENEIVVQSIE